MSSGKNNDPPPGRILRSQASFRSMTASPLTPRLAPNATATKRDPSPRRPLLRGATSTSRNTSPEKGNIVTPARAFVKDKSTPLSSARAKAKPGSAVSTPASVNTPVSIRAGTTPLLRPRLAASHSVTADGRGTPGQGRDLPSLSPLAQEPTFPGRSQSIDDVVIRNPNSMFFHADDARSQSKSTNPAPGPIKKAAAFFYANGQKDESTPARSSRPASPALSMIGGERRPLISTTRSGTSEIGLGTRQVLKSPTLSAISFAHSPFGISPTATSPSTLLPSPPPVDYLNTPSATLNIAKLRAERSSFDYPSPQTPSPNALGVILDDTPVTPGKKTTPGKHAKSSSICVIPAESPSSARKRSATWAQVKAEDNTFISRLESAHDANQNQRPSSALQRTNTSPSMSGSKAGDAPQSPSRDMMDYAADARRERKVLDLEISNSSLLAINRSLEREMKKQKQELKRYRRLSRAGRFSRAMQGDLDDDEDGLPHIDGALDGRPSSPFQEDVSDLDVSDEESSDAEGTADKSDATAKDKQRAKDEAQLRNDLRKHRELLLDTARMNRSLQRCLAWTEDLIKDGKKALDRNVQSHDLTLGGRIKDADESDEEALQDEDAENEDQDAVEGEQDDFTGITAFLGAGPWRDRQSSESHSTNRDSVLDMSKSSDRAAGMPIKV